MIGKCVNVNLVRVFWSWEIAVQEKQRCKKEAHWLLNLNCRQDFALHFSTPSLWPFGFAMEAAPGGGKVMRSWKCKEMDLSASLWVSVTNMDIPPGCFTRQDCHLRERILEKRKLWSQDLKHWIITCWERIQKCPYLGIIHPSISSTVLHLSLTCYSIDNEFC